MNYVGWNELCLKYHGFTPSGCKNIKITKFELHNTQYTIHNTQYTVAKFAKILLCILMHGYQM